ncbi:MAG: argininosuccinate synthase [Cenarchaeum symbiont of Oopsacas minuta]|nr:argininosuccinate synthase [Cenarchaeum symbiont of Oopsacas minuta]
MSKKAVLAFSGGLDTSVVVKYLLEEYDMDTVTVTVDVGQQDDYRKVAAKSKKLGAVKHVHIDAKTEFVTDYVYPAIKANALYQKKYSLATALARPLIAKKLITVAAKENASALAHGCSGKGNDQVRFDATLHAKSNLPILAPIREMNLDRNTELAFAKKHGISIDKVAKKFSIDQNLWGRAIEGGIVEDASKEPPESAFEWIRVSNALKNPSYIEIGFNCGIPVSVDGKRMNPVSLVEYVNNKAGAAGVGILDHIEDRIVGIKSREIYEAPAATCIIEAHRDLEKLIHTKHQTRFKSTIDDQWAELAYSGLWEDPLREDLDGYISNSQRYVTGTVRIRMHHGSLRVVGRSSKYSLYNVKSSTYGLDSTFDQRLAMGFVALWGMQSTEANKLQDKMSAKT